MKSATSSSVGKVPLVASFLAMAAGVVWSLGALVARLAKGADAFQYLTWRSIGVFVVIEAMALRRGERLIVRRAFAGRAMMGATGGLGLASLAFVYAVKNTTGANAAFLSSLTPLFAALLARLVLHERLTRVTVACGVVALGGLAMTVLGDLGTGNMKGNLAAMLSCVGFAIYMVCIRSSATRDWSPALPGYAVGMVALCATITLLNGRTLVPSAHDIVLALLHGGVLIVFGTLIFNVASKSVPAVGMALFALIENALVPIWIFLWLNERPTAMSLLGGLVIMAAVVAKALLDGRRRLEDTALGISHEGA